MIFVLGILAVAYAWGAVLMIAGVATAPEGIEDAAGFHAVSVRGVGRSPAGQRQSRLVVDGPAAL